MSPSSKPLTQPVAKIAAKFKQLRALDHEAGAEYEESVEGVIRSAHHVGYAATTSKPRRGCVVEYKQHLKYVVPALLKVSRNNVLPASGNVINFKAGEMWREAECFLQSPYSFARLKQLPELRQIISHTCLDVVYAAAGRMTCIAAGAALPVQQQQQQQQQGDDADKDTAKQQRQRQQQQQRSRKSKSKPQQRGWDALEDLDSDDFDFDSDGSLDLNFDRMQGGSKQHASAAANDRLRYLLRDSETPLLLHLAPGLRLCLAAEVALGMLCPGQEAPPDTPEHAAALQMFVLEACAHAEAETFGESSRLGQLPLNTPAAVSEMLLGLVPSKEHRGRRYFPASTVHRSPLAPHLDLQLQLPPQQLLQLVTEAANAAAHQQLPQKLQEATQLSSPGVLSQLHPACQQQLLQLMAPWRDAAAGFATILSDSSSAEDMFASLLEDCKSLLEHAGKQSPPQQQQQQQQGGGRDTVTTSPAAGSSIAAAPAGPDTEPGSSSDTTGSSCMDYKAAASKPCVPDAVLHRMSTFASCLVLQFVEEACPADGAATTPAWQQAVPLQVLLLCSQVQQLQGAMQRCISKLAQSSEQQQQDDEQQQVQQQGQQQGQRQQEGQQQGRSWQEGQQAEQQGSDQPQQNDIEQSAQSQQSLTVLVEHVVSLLQSIRRFNNVNEAMNSAVSSADDTAAAAATAAAPAEALSSRPQPNSSSTSNGDSDDSDGTQVVRQLDSASFFSAAGPLAAGLWGFKQPIGAAVWASPAAAAAAAGTASPQEQQKGQLQQQAEQAGELRSCLGRQTSSLSHAATQSAVPQQAWQALLGSCAWQHALQDVDETVAANLQRSEEMLQQLQMQLFRFVRDVSPEDKLAADAYVQQFKALGLEDFNTHAAVHVCAVPHVLERTVAAMRGAAITRLGFDERKWERRMLTLAERKSRRLALVRRLSAAGYGKLRNGTWVFSQMEIRTAQSEGVLAPHEDPLEMENPNTWDNEDELDIMRREKDADIKILKEQQRKIEAVDEDLKVILAELCDEGREQLPNQDLRQWENITQPQTPLVVGSPASTSSHHNAGGSWGSSTSSGSSISPRAVPPLAAGLVNGTAAASSSLLGASHAGSTWNLPEEVDKGELALREFAAQCSALFAPLLAWYTDWREQKDSMYMQSTAWWESNERLRLAATGARGSKPLPTSGPAAGQKSGSHEWKSGGYDHCASCPLCQQDQQQRQQQQQQDDRHASEALNSGSGLGNGVSASHDECGGGDAADTVSYSDPFMWRRLLWQLLGKLSPESQAFYAQYLAVCPHCPEPIVWHQVRRSLIVSIWSSPAADVAEQQLAHPSAISIHDNAKRCGRIVQYARTLNQGYVQHQHACLPLQAKQLLLALSPLHAQLLPRPETAFLCPSSFPAAVGKALAGQLLCRPVLDMFQHDQAHLSMWHVWWHIGLRRYAAAKQQQQQQADGTHGLTDLRVSSWQRDALSSAELDALYMDPDAKVHAVHFATRQLSGTNSNACSSSSSSSSSSSVVASRPGVSPAAAAAGDAALQAALHVADMAQRRIIVKAVEDNLQREVQKLAPGQVTSIGADVAATPSPLHDSYNGSGSGETASSSSAAAAGAGDAAVDGVAKAELLLNQTRVLIRSMCADMAMAERPMLLEALHVHWLTHNRILTPLKGSRLLTVCMHDGVLSCKRNGWLRAGHRLCITDPAGGLLKSSCPMQKYPAGELLAPAAQRLLLTQHDARTAGIQAASVFLKLFTCAPEGDSKVARLQFEETLKRVQEWQQQQPLHWLQPQSDIQALALQPPVPIEALVQQDIFTIYLTSVQSCFSSCDGCGQDIEADDEVQECADCCVAKYCCPECLANNAAEHAIICQTLARGKQRYICANFLKEGSGAGSRQALAFWGMLQPLLQPAPEPLAFSADAGAVDSCGCVAADEINALGLLPMQLFVAEAGRLYGQDMTAHTTMSPAERAVVPWTRYMP